MPLGQLHPVGRGVLKAHQRQGAGRRRLRILGQVGPGGIVGHRKRGDAPSGPRAKATISAASRGRSSALTAVATQSLTGRAIPSISAVSGASKLVWYQACSPATFSTGVAAISLVGLVILVFFLSRLTGDPTDLYLPVDASLQAREQFREINGLNDPLMVQFGRYVADLAVLDFGNSIRRSRPAIDVVLEGFAWTLWLACVTMLLVTFAAIVIGSLAAFKVGGIFDRIATFFSLIGASAPDFWIAIVAIVVFAVNLRWLPTSGTGTIWHWVLPVSVLFIRPFGLILQVVRGSMIGVLSSAYVKTARAKGVRNRPIIFVHGLRNGMLPVITVIGVT